MPCFKCTTVRIRKLLCTLYCIGLFIFGLSSVVFGAVWLYKIFYHFLFFPSESVGPYFIILLLGVFDIVLTWLALRGLNQENDLRLLTAVLLFCCMLIGEIAVATWVIVLYRDMDIFVLDLMSDAFDDYLDDSYYIPDWDRLQSSMECCGVHDQTDFPKYPPLSCCGPRTETDPCPEIFSEGCLIRVTRYAVSLMADAMIVCFSSAFYKALGVIAYVYYYKALRFERKRLKELRLTQQREADEAQRALMVPPARDNIQPTAPQYPERPPPYSSPKHLHYSDTDNRDKRTEGETPPQVTASPVGDVSERAERVAVAEAKYPKQM